MMLKLKEDNATYATYLNVDRVQRVLLYDSTVFLRFSITYEDTMRYDKSTHPESYREIRQYSEKYYG